MIQQPQICWEEQHVDQGFWKPGDVITVSFYQPPTPVPPIQWEFTIGLIADRVPQNYMPLERSARAQATPEDSIRHVVLTYIQPVVAPAITFQFVPHDGDVSVRLDPNGGSCSMVGTGCLYQTRPWTMSFAWLDVGTIIHEFSHVLGMQHVMYKSHIKWNLPVVYAYFKLKFGWTKADTDKNLLMVHVTTQDFDSNSIMVYPIPPYLTLDGTRTAVSVRYSQEDIQFLQRQYGIQRNHGALVSAVEAPEASDTSANPVWLILALAVALGIVLWLQNSFH